MRRGATCTALLLAVAPAQAIDHYVSPTGTAAWSVSTESRAPCSLDTANAQVQAGDTVLLLPGRYSAGIAPAGSGRSEAEPIAYRAMGPVLRSPGNIARRNLCYANGAAGISLASMQVSRPEGNFLYANTLFRNGYDAEVDSFWRGGLSFGNWGNGPMPGNVVVNNILQGNWNGAAITGYGEAGPQRIGENWTEEGAPGFVDDRLPEDPQDADLPDLRLQTGSPCIDRGVFLTRVTGDAGSGLRLPVEDAGYFFDGWGIAGETGDLIQLEGQEATARITAVDYQGKIITVETPLTWQSGQGVSVPYRGTAPDLGALEHEDAARPAPE